METDRTSKSISEEDNYYKLEIDGCVYKLSKWHTELRNTKTLQQLKQEPKVVIKKHSHISRFATDEPDINNVGSYIECSTSTTSNSRYNHVDKMEKELRKMFEIEQNNHEEVSKIQKMKKNKKSSKRRQSLKELLIQLFGSTLDDIEFPREKQRKSVTSRRHTLPVSIQVDSSFIEPMRISQKRKSETDVIFSTKLQKIDKLPVNGVIEVLSVEYMTVADLILPPVYSAKADASSSCDLNEAIVINQPILGESISIKMDKTLPAFIDLTGGNFDETEPTEFNGIRNEIYNNFKSENIEASNRSETANIPHAALSMPLLSPVSPVQPSQAEAILPQDTLKTNLARPGVIQNPQKLATVMEQIRDISTTNRSVDFEIKKNNFLTPQKTNLEKISELNKKFPCVMNNFHHQMQDKFHTIMRNVENTQCQPRESFSKTSHSSQQKSSQIKIQNVMSNFGLKSSNTSEEVNKRVNQSSLPKINILSNQTFNSQMMQQPCPNVSIQPPCPSVTQKVSLHSTPTTSKTTYQPPNIQTGQISTSNPQSMLHIPQLHILFRNNQMSNIAFADMLLPHVARVVQWRTLINSFYQEAKLCFFNSSELREDFFRFRGYANSTLKVFGLKLVSDLWNVDVQNFQINDVLLAISTKLAMKDKTISIYRVCTSINLMLKEVEENCTTPFLKRFLYCIKMANEKMEQVINPKDDFQLFTVDQLRQLEAQIKQFHSINAWINTSMQKLNNQMRISFIMNNIKNAANPANPSVKRTSRNDINTSKQKTSKTYSNNKSNGNGSLLSALLNTPNTISDNSNVDNNVTSSINNNILSSNLHQLMPTNSNIISCQQSRKENNLNTGTQQTSQDNTRINIQNSQISFQPSISQSAIAPPKLPEVMQSNAPVPSNIVPKKVQNSRMCSDEKNTLDNEKPSNICDSAPEVSSTLKSETKDGIIDDIIDLTWIDDGDQKEIVEEVMECKAFPFKIEDGIIEIEDDDIPVREVVSPTDSGLGSPVTHDDSFRCLCGNKAIYVCACNLSMYCSTNCQIKDWNSHQKLCYKNMS